VSDSIGFFGAAAGVFIITFMARVLPCVGAVFGFVVSAIGLGAVVLTRFGARTYPEEVQAMAGATALLDDGDELESPAEG